ncbi:MAG: hypothetical protein MZW92_65980 [Comamonadaceae bacterium]|nr:hypothetical protein [Comamonadaceae bacterium]
MVSTKRIGGHLCNRRPDEFTAPSSRRQVLAECQQPGASVAAVALAHDLNANLVRRWLAGRGLKRTGSWHRAVSSPSASPTSTPPAGEDEAAPAAALRFLPVELSVPSVAVPTAELDEPACSDATIDIELHRGRHRTARALARRAGRGRARLGCASSRCWPMIRIDALWLCGRSRMDMRAGAERLLASVVQLRSARRTRTTATCSPTRAPRASSCSCTTASACGARRGD